MLAAPVVPDDTVGRAREMTGRIGLIRTCKTLLMSAGEPRIHAVSAIPTNTRLYMGSEISGDTGAAGFSHEHALMGAIGECIERYCCAYIDRNKLVVASQDELGPEAIGFDEFAIHEPAQYDANFPFSPYRADRPISWAEGRSLITGARRFVPASLVHVPYMPRDRADFLCLAVSSGQACHTDRDQAILTGLYEVVERDAFMIAWLRRLPLPQVDYLADPECAAVYERHFAGCDLEFRVYDMTLDLAIPSMLCVVEGRSARGPIIGTGAATRVSPRDAVIKSLLEAAQDMIWCRDLVRRRADWRPAPDFSNVVTFEDHVRLYCEPEMKAHLSFLYETPRRAGVDAAAGASLRHDPAAALARCLDLLRAAGIECVLVDTTTPEVAAAGFHAPKVLIPGLVPLVGDHRYPMNGSPRLRTVPEKLGYHDAFAGLNPTPHPFP